MIRAFYSCKGCGLANVDVDLRVRGPDEDVVEWMESVKFSVSVNHRTRSPGCLSMQASDLKIPLPPNGRIGDPA